MKTEIEDRLIKFCVRSYKLAGALQKTEFTSTLSNQLIRSVTSAALNYGEAQGSETTKDFVHKIGIVIKELRESRVNFKIIRESDIYQDIVDLEDILKENDELIAILYSALKTAKNKLGNNG